MKLRGTFWFWAWCRVAVFVAMVAMWACAAAQSLSSPNSAPVAPATPAASAKSAKPAVPAKPVFIDSPSHQLQEASGSGSASGLTAASGSSVAEAKRVHHSAVFSAAGVGTKSAAAQGRKTPATSSRAATGNAANYTTANATGRVPTTASASTRGNAASTRGTSSKTSRNAASSLSRQGKLVYVSLDVSPVFNWYAYVNSPFNRKGCQVFVNPSVAVDFDLGYYMMVGTGLALNTTGGCLQFTSNYVREMERLGYTCYDKVLRTYTAMYLELPLTFKMQGNITQDWQFFGSVGGYFGVRVWARFRDRFDDFKSPDYTASNPLGAVHQIDGTLIRKGKLDKELNRWNVAAGLRLGASYLLSDAVALRFGLGYRYGFLDAFSAYHERPDGVAPTIKPQQVEAFVGFTF